jgi:hypothetical protein
MDLTNEQWEVLEPLIPGLLRFVPGRGETAPRGRAVAQPFRGSRRPYHRLEAYHDRQLVRQRGSHGRDRFRDGRMSDMAIGRTTPALMGLFWVVTPQRRDARGGLQGFSLLASWVPTAQGKTIPGVLVGRDTVPVGFAPPRLQQLHGPLRGSFILDFRALRRQAVSPPVLPHHSVA